MIPMRKLLPVPHSQQRREGSTALLALAEAEENKRREIADLEEEETSPGDLLDA